MANIERELREQSGDGDGDVSIENAELAAVTDLVKLPADHSSMVMTTNNQPPVACDAVKERLVK